MAQNLVINGVTYNSVNSLSIPKLDGGYAVFPDTSDATAEAGDIAEGKTAYIDGSKVTGTATGGTPNLQSKSVSYTSNGSATVTPDSGYDGLSSVAVTVDVSGGGVDFREIVPTSDMSWKALFIELPNGEQMTLYDLWQTPNSLIWDKVVDSGTAKTFIIVNVSDTFIASSTQIKMITINYYIFQGNLSRATWRRCLNGSSAATMADTLTFKAGSTYLYYWF